MNFKSYSSVEIIFGNSNKRFSGVTSTMLQVLPYAAKLADVAVLGRHHLPESVRVLTFLQASRLLRYPLPDGRYRVFHARRNDEMLQALLLKYVFRSKIKIVFTSTAQRKKSWITRWLMRQMDGLISTCQAAADYMPQPPDVIIPHGIDSGFLSNSANSGAAGVKLPARFNIGLFGRVRAQKGVDLLVEAACKLLPDNPEWGVVFVGEITPEQKNFLHQQKAKLERSGISDRVVFTDKRPFEEVPVYFQQVDIVCALSVNEGFGLTVLEGAMSSKPIIATQAGAWPDIMTKAEMGYLIDVADGSALVAKLQLLMQDANTRLRLGRNGHDLVLSTYTVDREASQLVDFYRTVANR